MPRSLLKTLRDEPQKMLLQWSNLNEMKAKRVFAAERGKENMFFVFCFFFFKVEKAVLVIKAYVVPGTKATFKSA